MAGIGNNLYPPIIETYTPAFVRNTGGRIYFSLSSYNNAEDIKNVQIIVSSQNTNHSALNAELYPSAIKITNLSIDNTIQNDYRYFVTISPGDMVGGIFEINQFYKVQIRFTGTGAQDIVDSKKIASWLIDNQNFFSEWSTVSLIRGIEQPLIYLKNFEGAAINAETILTTELVEIVGGMYYVSNAEVEKESLKSYEILIYENETDLVLKTGELYTNEYNPNEINYNLKQTLEDGVAYKIQLNYTTSNGYTNGVSYYFSIVKNAAPDLEATISASPENDNGRIAVLLKATNPEPFLGTIIIRRTSSETNFSIWEDVHINTLASNQALDYTWFDYTAKSGVWYEYCGQRRGSNGERSAIVKTEKPCMLYIDDIFLTRSNMQLKIRFNPSISSFKTTFSESKTDTIGSKYPYITRNANIAYRQFPISGLISEFCDEDEVFIKKEQVYGDSLRDYENFNSTNQISRHKDFIYEKAFRDKIIDFLQDNSVKLFKSLTEGNILIKLMDISFSPEESLGRMIYSFSATAYEVDECTVENYEKYGIQVFGTYTDYVEYNYQKIGQLYQTFNGHGDNVFNILQKKYEALEVDEFDNIINKITWVRIVCESDPYLISVGIDGSLEPVLSGSTNIQNTTSGYIVYINEEPIVINKRGFYELIDSDTNINSIWFPKETSAIVDYEVDIDVKEKQPRLASRLYYTKKAGQLYGTQEVNKSITKEIYLKYLLNFTDFYQEVVSINRITIEANPGVVLYIKDTFDSDYYRHVIGDTGVLEFYDEEAIIDEMYFRGVHLYQYTDADRLEVPDGYFIETGVVAESVEEIENPVKNGVYSLTSPMPIQQSYYNNLVNTIGMSSPSDKKNATAMFTESLSDGTRVIYHNNKWYHFTIDNDIIMDIDAIVDYVFELIKGEY